MAFKKPTTHAAVPESPDRLFRDLPRRKHASLFDHQGQVLRNYVAHALNASDVALQLPTGSGKTLVGLLLAEWRRRKFRERVVYLCPTRQLVNQVAEEASSKYGLTVEAFTGKVKNYTPEAKAAYADGERVAVTTYNSLFNTNPFFETPDIVIVDDAHAAENYIASQWTMRVSRFEDSDKTLFQAIAGVLKSVLSESNYMRLTGNWKSVDDASWVDKIPTHKLIEVADELRAVISENIDESDQRFAWRMLEGHVRACQLYVSSSEVLLRPLIPPTWSHRPFTNATQRIFMSATLGAGGDLERLTGRPNIKRLSIPEGWDRQGIGRRFFIFPEKSLDETSTQKLRRELMRKAGRSLVLTPSQAEADEIVEDVTENLKYSVFSASDLESSKTEFTQSTKAVAVIANRYDGIDFPEDDCRLQFVEGLPRATNLQERFLMNRMGASLLFNERVQTRVLQAIGRCTRGLNDYSAVVVTGEDLPAYLTDRKRRAYFHPELQAELEFGIDQSTQVKAQDILSNFDIFLEHDQDWEDANQGILEAREAATQAEFPAMDQLEDVVAQEVKWQTAMWNEDYVSAYEAAREVLGGLNDGGLRGYRALWHYLAGAAAELADADGEVGFEAHARTQYRKAKEAANGIPWLISLARGNTATSSVDEQDQTTTMLQVEQLEAQLVKLGTVHNRNFSAREREIREGLQDGDRFEQAQLLLGEHLGFSAGKRETDASPDPWWIVGGIALVFEDHANAKGDTAIIDATKARQAASHPDWMREHVPATSAASIQPILVTPAKRAKDGAMPHLGRVAYWGLEEFREWAESALVTVRELRRNFREPGDLAWRAQAAEELSKIRADAPGLYAWLAARPARDHLKKVS
ncbi:DEAD/DEAH box helicase [Burkholderia ubonensis]|uniref:DEAD/DEAH box helicase n=1 Tax=Burkholderia ubonensis TaxID=101571 RepID=A0ABD4E2A8_9BURK|nr:DEAD/DEAH box helicase [Burkholderia ubonensis]KVN86152.1 DEAD/DEAH box helicase [Burkholderia ubonensis]KVZ64640.1 DEAD/DEAH box helicase [Burkholderia ubonensis]KVZ79619.1 DEAD/DEAH box helicase [Burkholderia ubonensis]KWA82292.1 DEAD/DEAH box helicase [Burkholderia ubonensis]KWB25732.1 DEAD/DEAH box helicase [Burkholderia ubonensis]